MLATRANFWGLCLSPEKIFFVLTTRAKSRVYFSHLKIRCAGNLGKVQEPQKSPESKMCW